MIRRYFASFAIVLFLITSGFAQNVEKTGGYARLLGMGNNPYVMDPYSSTINPAWGAVYDNFLFGDLGAQGGGNAGQFVSANFGVGKDFTLGMILARNDFNGFSISRLDPGGLLGQGVVNTLNSIVPGAVIGLQNNFEIMGTMTFGKTSVGLGIAYASTKNDNTPAGGGGTEGSASQIGINAGVLAQISGNLKLDLGASFVLPGATFKPSATGQTESKVSQTIIGVNARLFWRYTSKLSFVPTVGFLTASGTADNGTVSPSTSVDLPSVTAITAGFGINYQVGDFLLAGGPAFATTSITTPSVPNVSPELKTSALTFPLWNLGLEWKMNDWLIGRMGYVGATSSVTNESAATATTINEVVGTQFVPYGATFGVGFRLGNFSLDGTVNVEVIRQGLNNIGNFGPTFAYMSASYAIP
ncbi:MAG: hypothetical protein IPM56_03505 [Ignavibacteriales bacterium]|nr:MAG: hypothetical protein IPM56_03505 [Ignavibacteriales bacterium]